MLVPLFYFARNLHLHPFFKFANSKGSSESGKMTSLVRAFACCVCDKYQSRWLIVRKPLFFA